MGGVGKCQRDIRHTRAGPTRRQAILRVDPRCGDRERHTGHSRRLFAGGYTWRDIDFRSVFMRGHRLAGRIEVHALMYVQKSAVTRLHVARVRMDERDHRLQRDEEPEHQQAEGTVEHGQGTFSREKLLYQNLDNSSHRRTGQNTFDSAG